MHMPLLCGSGIKNLIGFLLDHLIISSDFLANVDGPIIRW